MADEKQLNILKSGVKAWNEWKNSNGFTKYDLSQADLSQTNLYQAALCGVNLGQANLSQADLRRADLGSANLGGANLSQASMCQAHSRTGANLSQANLHQAGLHQAYLPHSNLSQADLSEANLSLANLREANLSGANLKRANLFIVDLRQANLSQATLDQANLAQALYNDLTLWPRAFKIPAEAVRSDRTDIKIRVTNLAPHFTVGDLAYLFEPYGDIMTIYLSLEGQGQLEMRQEAGQQAIKALHGQIIKGQSLSVRQVARILTIDDNAETRLLYERILACSGYECASVGEGQSALAHMGSMLPEICLLDIHLPGMDGDEIYAKMKADPYLRKIGVILVTGWVTYRDGHSPQDFLDSRDRIMYKPIDISALLDNVEQMLIDYNKPHLAIQRNQDK